MIPRNQLKEAKELYSENHKTLIRKIENDGQKRIDIPFPCIGKVNIIKSLWQAILRLFAPLIVIFYPFRLFSDARFKLVLFIYYYQTNLFFFYMLSRSSSSKIINEIGTPLD